MTQRMQPADYSNMLEICYYNNCSCYLVRLVVDQTAAEVGVAPGEGLAPGGRNQNFVLLHGEDPFVCAHDLSHRLLQLCTRGHKDTWLRFNLYLYYNGLN